MVLILRTLLAKEHKSIRQHLRSSFLDSLRIHVKGGSGGNGLPRYGGVGGQGGCVFLSATEKETLKNVQKKWPLKRVTATHGGDSHNKRIIGERGTDIKIDVPVGVTVVDENGVIISELNVEGSTCLAAGGGPGGGPNNSFLGMKGQSRIITLDLKLIANVGLVGLPNAGKSTFLKAVSQANPKIAGYPFTTIRPNIGIMEFPDYRQISVADLPGLIEGAHVNIGMGHKFLKHVERTSLLLLVCDVGGFQLSPKHQLRTCLDSVFILNRELELYKPDLLEKPAMLLINKMDTPGANEIYEAIKYKLHKLNDNVEDCPVEIRPEQIIKFDRVIPISAKNRGDDIKFVKNSIREVLDLYADNNSSVIEGQVFTELKEKMIERGPKLT